MAWSLRHIRGESLPFNLEHSAGPRPPHPGAILRAEAIPASRASKSEIAKMLGVTSPYLGSILNEQKPITPEIAARLGKMFSNGAGFWIDMQAAHDKWVAQNSIDVSKTPELAAPMLALAKMEPMNFVPRRKAPGWLPWAAAAAVLMLSFSAMGLVVLALIPALLLIAFCAGGAAVLTLQRFRSRTRRY